MLVEAKFKIKLNYRKPDKTFAIEFHIKMKWFQYHWPKCEIFIEYFKKHWAMNPIGAMEHFVICVLRENVLRIYFRKRYWNWRCSSYSVFIWCIKCLTLFLFTPIPIYLSGFPQIYELQYHIGVSHFGIVWRLEINSKESTVDQSRWTSIRIVLKSVFQVWKKSQK